MRKFISLRYLDNRLLHDDLILDIPSINLSVVSDSYYYAASKLIPHIEDVHGKNLIIIGILNNWKKMIASLENGDVCFLPFDFADEYIGCLKLLLVGDCINGVYGFTQKILGMMIDPLDLNCFDIHVSDFEPDTDCFFASKSLMEISIDENLHELIGHMDKF